MVFSVIGVGLFMPSLGVRAIILPLIARLYLAGELDTFNIYDAMLAMPWSLVLNLGGYVFVLGIAIFAWVILRNDNFPRLPAILFLAGWIAFIVFAVEASKFQMICTGALIFIGGIGLAISIWIQAPLLFKPAAVSTQKADS
jgi:hypothetical protein